MKATIDTKRNMLVIEMPLTVPTLSSTGKSMLVCTTHGGKVADGLTIGGKPLTISVNAFIPAK